MDRCEPSLSEALRFESPTAKTAQISLGFAQLSGGNSRPHTSSILKEIGAASMRRDTVRPQCIADIHSLSG